MSDRKPVHPTIGVYLTRLLHVMLDGREVEGGLAFTLTTTYAGGSDHNKSMVFPCAPGDVGKQIEDLTKIEVLDWIRNGSDEASDTIQFAEEIGDGIVFGGEFVSWETLVEAGYEFRSPTRRNIRGSNRSF